MINEKNESVKLKSFEAFCNFLNLLGCPAVHVCKFAVRVEGRSPDIINTTGLTACGRFWCGCRHHSHYLQFLEEIEYVLWAWKNTHFFYVLNCHVLHCALWTLNPSLLCKFSPFDSWKAWNASVLKSCRKFYWRPFKRALARCCHNLVWFLPWTFFALLFLLTGWFVVLNHAPCKFPFGIR